MGDARVGARTVDALREPPSRRLRRLRIAHERMARRPGSGTERAPKTVVGVVADAETGQVLGLEELVKRDSDGFMEWLGDFVVTAWKRWTRTTLARASRRSSVWEWTIRFAWPA